MKSCVCMLSAVNSYLQESSKHEIAGEEVHMIKLMKSCVCLQL